MLHDVNFYWYLLHWHGEFQCYSARSPFHFIVLMVISYNHFYVTNYTNTSCSVDVSVSVNSNMDGPSINIFDNFFFYNSSRSKNVKKLNCWHPKEVTILIIWISCPSFSYFCCLLIFWENGKMILSSKWYLLVSLF